MDNSINIRIGALTQTISYGSAEGDYDRKQCFYCIRVVSGKFFQHSLMFIGKCRSVTCSEATKRCFTQVGPGLTLKYYTRLERLTKNKHSSLLDPLKSYEEYEIL